MLQLDRRIIAGFIGRGKRSRAGRIKRIAHRSSPAPAHVRRLARIVQRAAADRFVMDQRRVRRVDDVEFLFAQVQRNLILYRPSAAVR